MLFHVSVHPPVAPYADIQVTVSSPYQDGVTAKQGGKPKQIPEMEFENDADQIEYELAWLAGWESADINLKAVLKAKTGIEEAVENMSDAQLHREVYAMKQRWHVALKSWSPELAWQQAIVCQVTKRGQRHVLV